MTIMKDGTIAGTLGVMGLLAVCFLAAASVYEAAFAAEPCPEKCDKENPVKCQASGECNCVVIPIPLLDDRCSTPCPKDPGYWKCVHHEGSTCDPDETTKVWCESRGWKWDGPGNPDTCPDNYNCTTDTPKAKYKDAIYHASCDR
jgi:hypothetical protein